MADSGPGGLGRSCSRPPGSTLLTQRRETPDGISPLALELTDGFIGGRETSTETMRRGMRETPGLLEVSAEAP